MEEFFINDYVVETEYGHPGRTVYTVYSTRENMTAMVYALSDAIEKPPGDEQRPFGKDVLWQHYATTAYGSTCRVWLSFRVADDLSRFHVRPGFVRSMRGWLKSACWLAFTVFAIVGAYATASDLIKLNPYIQYVLFGVPLVGFAVGILYLWDSVRRPRHRR